MLFSHKSSPIYLCPLHIIFTLSGEEQFILTNEGSNRVWRSVINQLLCATQITHCYFIHKVDYILRNSLDFKKMVPEVKADIMSKRGSKWSILSIALLFLSISSFVFPVIGFSLRTCRISYGNALCSKTNLTSVPRDIPSTVKGFDLSVNKISKIEVLDFKNLPGLTELNLRRNWITQIDEGAFAGLSSLKTLNLNNNRLSKLGDYVFNGLSKLTELRIISNGIKTVAPTSFMSLTSLKFLDISYNKLNRVAKFNSILQHLPHLQELVIQKSGITTFRSWELTNTSIQLTSLDLSQNLLEVFSITADVFPNLTWLNIGGPPRRKHITWDVRNNTFLSRVTTLDIGGLQLSLNDMKTLLESFNTSLTTLRMNAMKHNLRELINISCTIPTLSSLQLRRNKLSSSDLFQACVNITELDLAENCIKNVSDDSFRSLPGLRILSLNRNGLSSVPSVIRNLSTLVELDLSTNSISSLGCHDFANLTYLRKLSLYQNSISALQQCVFKDLIRLQYLKLQTNHITKLNAAFKENLPYLKQLHLNRNKLTSISEGEFKGLQSLQNLSLHENQINDLAEDSFIGLTNLTDIQLQSNEILLHAVQKSVFNGLINLRRLDVRDNHIRYESTEYLSDPPFSQLSRLEMLSMPAQHRRGKTIRLPQNLLDGLTNLLVFNIRNIQLLSLHADMFKYTPQLQQLDISSNELMDISPDLFSPIPNLKSLYLSRTSLQSLDFFLKANLTKLEFLQARKNQFSVVSEDVMKSIPALEYLDFQGNSFTCDCDNAWFLQWVENNNQTQVFDAYNFVCNYPKNVKGMKLLDLDVRSCSVDTGFICFVSTTCSILLFMLVSFIYHFLRWQVVYAYYLLLALLFDTKQKNKQAASQYDAFISYNIHDEPWVIRELLPKLEAERDWKLCLHHRDFLPGKPIIENIAEAIYGSRKTLCVISRRYLESEWCSREIQMAR
ncbi:hypothetical protein PAMA_008370 [Pampus argenteus]